MITVQVLLNGGIGRFLVLSDETAVVDQNGTLYVHRFATTVLLQPAEPHVFLQSTNGQLYGGLSRIGTFRFLRVQEVPTDFVRVEDIGYKVGPRSQTVRADLIRP